MKSSPKDAEQAELSYISALQIAFIVQYKISQIKEILTNYTNTLKHPVPTSPELDIHFMPRVAISALQLSLDHHKKKRVNVEFQKGCNLQASIASVFDTPTIKHIHQAIQYYLADCNEVIQAVRNLQIPSLQEVVTFDEFKTKQALTWEHYGLQQLCDRIDAFDVEGLLNLVEKILESTRKTVSIEAVRKQLASLNKQPTNSINIDIYAIQGEFIDLHSYTGDVQSVVVQKLLVPGLNRNRFVKFAQCFDYYTPKETIESILHQSSANQQADQSILTTSFVQSPIRDMSHFASNSCQNQLDSTVGNLQLDQKTMGCPSSSRAVLNQTSLVASLPERRGDLSPQTIILSTSGMANVKQEVVQIHSYMQVPDKCSLQDVKLQLEYEFNKYIYWKDILFIVLQYIEYSNKQPLNLESLGTIEWHQLLQGQHTQLLHEQLGYALNNCIGLLSSLRDDQLFELAGDVPLTTRDTNTSLREQIGLLQPSRIIGMLLYSSATLLKQLNQIPTLIQHLDQSRHIMQSLQNIQSCYEEQTPLTPP